MTRLSVLVLALISLGGCAHTPSNANERVQFSVLEKIIPGTTTKEQARQLIGKPDKETSEKWEFLKGDIERLSVFFSDDSNIVTSWYWHVYEGDTEQNIKTTMNVFQNAKWKPETVKWINPHAFPNECYFNDQKLGVSIEYNRARKEVFSVQRWNPSRTITSKEETKSPIFCIGSFCSPGYSQKEFFKDVPITKYCEVPK